MSHKAGFASIIGKPNVGKSTLMNRLVGEGLSIVTSKAQTTRHRIKGILNTDEYQIVFSDTPGILEPHYLHYGWTTAAQCYRGIMEFIGRGSSACVPDFLAMTSEARTIEYDNADQKVCKLCPLKRLEFTDAFDG